MLELPLDPTISLEDTVSFYRELVHSGASIAEINCVRKHFSAIKGGRLAMQAEGILSYSLLISDVPLGHLDALASGPTLPDPSTVEQCQEILTRHGMMKRFPEPVRRFFSSPALPETPKAHQFNARALTLITSDDLADAAKRRAEDLGFYTVIDNTCDDWEYRRAAVYLLNRLRILRREHLRVCLISCGEVAVELPKASLHNNRVALHQQGIGGRNQHFALYAATLLGQSPNSTVILSVGTDGIDGNSLAAGAIVGELTLSKSVNSSHRTESNLLHQAQQALQCFDSGTFLNTVGSTIVTGATGNNLRDLRILMAQ
jgi:glycerate 2-kinase